MIWHVLVDPFGFAFMRRALVASIALSLAGPPLGVILVLRRMSLMSDVLQHGILPGLALGAMLGGLSFWTMGLGGLVAGLAVALFAGVTTRATRAREDSQLAGAYLIALALGVALIAHEQGIDLAELLFGSVLGVTASGLKLIAGAAVFVLCGIALVWRPLVLDSFDPLFFRSIGGRGALWHFAFLGLVVICVVAGYTTLGTLMSVGLMMLPAIAARHFALSLSGQVYVAVGLGILASAFGLLFSYWANLPSGPAIILTAGGFWLLGVLIGPEQSVRTRFRRRSHLTG